MNMQRLSNLKLLAQNELRFRGQVRGWKAIQDGYQYDNLTEQEARIVAHLVQQATVTLPEVPVSLLCWES